MNPQAQELNAIIQGKSPAIYDMLSDRGRNIFFPKTGILAQTKEAKGKKINATIGIATDEDEIPMYLQSINRYIDLPPQEVYTYAPSYGKQELRDLWKEAIYQKNPSLKTPISSPVVSCGLTHALSIFAYLFLDASEKIYMPEPFWGNYRLIFERGYDAVIENFPMFQGQQWNIAGLREKLNGPGEKKVLLLNFPNNPTGYTATQQEVEEITQVIAEAAQSGKKIVVAMDDAYFGLVYQPQVFEESLFAKIANLHSNVLAVKIDGATKEDFVWGFRVGFLTYSSQNISPEVCKALEDKTAGAIRGNISNASHLSQTLLTKALQDDIYQQDKQQKFALLKQRFEKVVEVLDQNPQYAKHFSAMPFNSGYFMCVALKNIDNAEVIRKILLERYDTGVISMGNLIRLAYSSLAIKYIPKLFSNIYEACESL